MIGDHIRNELRRPLEGDRNWISVQLGEFLVRQNPEHIARIACERSRLRVQEDIRNFRRTLNRRRCDLVLS